MQPSIEVVSHRIRPQSRPWRVRSASCKIPQATNAYKNKVFVEKHVSRTDVNLSPQMALKVLQAPLLMITWLPSTLAPAQKCQFYCGFIRCFNGGTIMALLLCYAHVPWHQKLHKMAFWPILLPIRATGVLCTPKRLISYPSNGPLWVDGEVFWTHFLPKHPSMNPLVADTRNDPSISRHATAHCQKISRPLSL